MEEPEGKKNNYSLLLVHNNPNLGLLVASSVLSMKSYYSLFSVNYFFGLYFKTFYGDNKQGSVVS